MTRARNAVSRQARVRPPAMGRVVRMSMTGNDSIFIALDSILQAAIVTEELALRGVSVQMEALQTEMGELRMESEAGGGRQDATPAPQP